MNIKPVAFFGLQGALPRRGQPVILAPPPHLGGSPGRVDQALGFKAVKHGVERAVGPGELAFGEIVDTLNDGVAVALAVVEDRKRGRTETATRTLGIMPGVG